MAKNRNSFEKRRREIEKKFKADEKRKNRLKKKSTDGESSDKNQQAGHPPEGLA